MSEQNNGQWAIVELMGHKVVAGYVTEETKFGTPLCRIDVPETSAHPQFTQLYGGSALYCVTPVSEEVARLTAERMKVNPVNVYVPELVTRKQLEQAVEQARRMLPDPDNDESEDD